MNQVKIDIPEGFEIDAFNQQTGTITFKPKPKKVTERVRTVTDLLKENGLTESQFDNQCQGLTKDEKAYRLIKMLVKTLNEGWTPDWDNGKYDKYFPWFYLDGGSSGFRSGGYVVWPSGSDVGSRLCFKNRELAEYAGTQFLSVYKDFMVIE